MILKGKSFRRIHAKGQSRHFDHIRP